MKQQKKWKPHDYAKGRSEVSVEPGKRILTWRSFIPFTKGFLKKKFLPTIYFDSTRLIKIYFVIFPAEGSCPNNFRFVIDNIQLIPLPKDFITVGIISEIKFDKKYSIVIAENPISFAFPNPGLVMIHYRIIDEKGKKPLDRNEKEILVAQRTLSGEIGRGFAHEPFVNEGQVPIIIRDYHQRILIRLTKVLNWLTVFLVFLTGILVIDKVVSILKGH